MFTRHIKKKRISGKNEWGKRRILLNYFVEFVERVDYDSLNLDTEKQLLLQLKRRKPIDLLKCAERGRRKKRVKLLAASVLYSVVRTWHPWLEAAGKYTDLFGEVKGGLHVQSARQYYEVWFSSSLAASQIQIDFLLTGSD